MHHIMSELLLLNRSKLGSLGLHDIYHPPLRHFFLHSGFFDLPRRTEYQKRGIRRIHGHPDSGLFLSN